MKILYVYDKMPGIYQNYLLILSNNIREKLHIKTLTYSKTTTGDFNIHSYGLLDNIYRLLYKLKLSPHRSMDIKIMNQFNLLHIQHSYLRRKLIPLLKQKNRPKTIITLRGGDTYMYPWSSEDWRNFYMESGDKIDAFITMSEHQKKYLTRWGVNESKIHVIPISFGSHSAAKPKYPNQECLKLVSAFRMTWEKNIEGCIQFARMLKDRNIPFIYDIYGAGSDLAELYYLIDRFELTSVINIKGAIDNEVLKSKLNEYDFFIQLSISEALPTSVLEAQAAGLPCVVSNSDGLPEAVIANETAIVGEYHNTEFFVDECLRVWNDRDLYFSFSANAIENANNNFSIEVETERLISLYQTLLKD